MSQNFPFKRKNFIKRKYTFSKVELWDEGFGWKSKYLKDQYNEVTSINGNTILRVVDPASHLCTTAQFAANSCIPYL